jgi:hypothetical protein
MSEQPTLDALQQQRVVEAFLDLAAVGWAWRKQEARGLLPPELCDEINRMADEWRGE